MLSQQSLFPFLAMTIASALPVPAVQAQQIMDPLTPAREGKLECGSVDPVKKTCHELARYRLRPDGQYDLSTDMVVATSPRIVMTWRGVVYVRNSMICSRLRRADFETTSFTVDGKEAGAELSYRIRQAWRPVNGEILDRESCLTITQRDGKFLEDYFLDGQADGKRKAIPMLWVEANQGYRLEP
jgi:hypothetical protein